MFRLTTRYFYWLPEIEPGYERLELLETDQWLRARGIVLQYRDGVHIRCNYEILVDADWNFLRMKILAASSNRHAPRHRRIRLCHEGDWQIDGEAAPELEGCSEVDIQATPFTNSLPIRRLKLGKGESAELRVVYLPVPELTPQVVEQRYTCLEPLGDSGGRYLYEGLFRDFRAELPVDPDGLVIDYPETFRRQWPR